MGSRAGIASTWAMRPAASGSSSQAATTSCTAGMVLAPLRMAGMQPWHSLPVDEVVAALGGDPQAGLTSAEASRRLAEMGPNTLGGDEGPGRLSLLLHQFADVLIWILIVAALVSGVLLNEWIDAGVILAIVVLNAILGFVQEARAESALARLKEMSAPEAVVVRDGGERRVPTAEVVPGDLLVLEAGDRLPPMPASSCAVRLEAEESALTGESFPAAKQVAPVAEGVSLGDRRSMLFSGTSIASGRGRAIVTGTGGDTEVGRLAEVLSQEEPPPPLKIEMARVGRRLAIICLGTAGLVFLDRPAARQGRRGHVPHLGGAGGGRHPRRPAHGGHHHALRRGAAHGRPPRHRPPPGRRRVARGGDRDLHRQDRHPDPQRDPGPGGGSRRAAGCDGGAAGRPTGESAASSRCPSCATTPGRPGRPTSAIPPRWPSSSPQPTSAPTPRRFGAAIPGSTSSPSTPGASACPPSTRTARAAAWSR